LYLITIANRWWSLWDIPWMSVLSFFIKSFSMKLKMKTFSIFALSFQIMFWKIQNECDFKNQILIVMTTPFSFTFFLLFISVALELLITL
jgi:hypothetical protein